MAVETLERLNQQLRFADDEDDMEDFPLRGGLTYRARKFADLLRTISRGTMLITGEIGSGKDLFAVSTAYLGKYLMGRRVLLDFLPKRAFGEYTLFNAQVMMQEINKMAKAAGVEGIVDTKDQEEYNQFIEEETVKWALEGKGMTLFKGAIIYLQELKRYCYKRNPHNKYNKFIGSLNSVVRHLDALMIGTHVKENEIDAFTYLQYAKIRAHCTWCLDPAKPNTTEVRIRRLALVTADAVYSNIEGRPVTIYVNGREPRSFLDGKCFYDLYKTKSMVNLKPVVKAEMGG